MSRRQEMEQFARLLEEQTRRNKICPIANVEPHEGQVPFVDGTAPIILALCGNRWGKSFINMCLLIAYALGYYPWKVPDFKLIRNAEGKWDFPPRSQIDSKYWTRRSDGLPSRLPANVLFLSGLSLSRGIGEIAQKAFLELWPESVEYKAYLGTLGVWQKLVLQNKSQIYFGSALQSGMAWEGFNSDYISIDEPIPRRVFTPVRRGTIDNCAPIRWSMTPIGDANMAWIVADILDSDRTDVDVIRGTSWDNPTLDRKALHDFFNDPTLTESERRARELGEVQALGRRVVSTFESNINVIPTTVIDPDVPRLLVADPHHSKPTVLIWFAVLDDGERLIAYREWPEGDFNKGKIPPQSTHDLAGTIKMLEGKESIEWRVCDPSFGRQHAKVLGDTFRSFQEEMSDYGLYFDTRTDNDVERGIQRLRDACKMNLTTKRPRLSIMRSCPNLIKSLNLWSYEEMTDGRLKVSEQYKDHCDCLRYALAYDFPISMDKGFSYLDQDEEE